MSQPKKQPYIVSWSGGKDSCLALTRAIQAFGTPQFLLNMLTENAERSRSHGLRKTVIQAQADALGVSILFYSATWDDYENTFITALQGLKNKGIEMGVFGDMKIENRPGWIAHRQWAEHVCHQAKIMVHEPLWDDTEERLLTDFWASRIKAKIISVKANLLDKKYLGESLTPALVDEFIQQGIHPLGETGEYHTVVFDSPLFSYPLDLRHGECILREGYRYLDVEKI
jgi:uncharacterized protein (TIGR00290 family)